MLVFSQLKHWANIMSVLARVGYCDEIKRVKVYNDSHTMIFCFLLIYQFRSGSYRSDFDIVRTSVVTLLSLERIGIVKGIFQDNCHSEDVKHN